MDIIILFIALIIIGYIWDLLQKPIECTKKAIDLINEADKTLASGLEKTRPSDEKRAQRKAKVEEFINKK